MLLPISFDEVSYFNNEYRGDLVVTAGVLYYFPHTRVSYARLEDELKGRDASEAFGLVGNLLPIAGLAPWAFEAVDQSVKFGKFVKRSLAPSVNNARIKDMSLWHGNEDSPILQRKLDDFIAEKKSESLQFDEDSVPKPMRFGANEMKNVRLGLKFKFDTEYDRHDFRINPIRHSLFKRALKEGGFI